MIQQYCVSIELLRIQTYLFAVPKLREMVGANVLLGEAVRNMLPALAVECGSGKAGVVVQSNADCHSAKVDNDPLTIVIGEDREQGSERVTDADDPVALYRQGILARDGGHFRVLMSDKEDAQKFVFGAEQLLRDTLPGLKFTVHPPTPLGENPNEYHQSNMARLHGTALANIPPFQICQAQGYGIANVQERGELISYGAESRRKAGERFRNQDTRDMIGLLSPLLPGQQQRPPDDFESLTDGDYLAVIHADGNGVGRRFKHWSKAAVDNLSRVEVEFRNEQFFHSMRVVVRHAVVDALGKTFGQDSAQQRPYQLLMLGGDDLLIICQARYALRFIVHYARSLEQAGSLCDGNPLSIGAGVVIAPHTIPFHHLYKLAETLAGSAKRLQRQIGGEVSVVDWIYSSESWTSDPIEQRRALDLIRQGEERLLLTGKPYPVLQVDTNNSYSLEQLLEQGESLYGHEASNPDEESSLNHKHLSESEQQRDIARSQLRKLITALPRGRFSAQLSWQEVTAEVRNSLENRGINTLWEQDNTDVDDYSTRLKDLVEIAEILQVRRRLKQAKGEESQ